MIEPQNIATICLGANTPDAASRLAEALAFLESKGYVRASSGQYFTAPEYAGETSPYLNEVIIFSTPSDYDTLHVGTKEYEASIRAMNTHAELVNLDIDIVRWNGSTIRHADAAAAYFRQGEELLK